MELALSIIFRAVVNRSQRAVVKFDSTTNCLWKNVKISAALLSTLPGRLNSMQLLLGGGPCVADPLMLLRPTR